MCIGDGALDVANLIFELDDERMDEAELRAEFDASEAQRRRQLGEPSAENAGRGMPLPNMYRIVSFNWATANVVCYLRIEISHTYKKKSHHLVTVTI